MQINKRVIKDIVIILLIIVIIISMIYFIYEVKDLKQMISEQRDLIENKSDKIESQKEAISEKNDTIQGQKEKIQEQKGGIEKTEELNEDKDNDGYTLRQEMIAGTSDNDRDSDDDGIIDSKDTNPLGGGRYIISTYKFSIEFTEYEIQLEIHSDYYDYYKDKPRTNVFKNYVNEEDPAIINLARELEILSRKNNYCDECVIMPFIHSFDYIKDEGTGFDDYRKYPIETLVEGNGDCEDTAFLMATLYKLMNHDTVLVFFKDLHMGVGVACDNCTEGSYYTFPDEAKRYYYAEPTSRLDWKLGELPGTFSGLQPQLYKV